MLLIIEHRGFGLANAPNPVPNATDLTDSHAAIIGATARKATGSRRRCRPRFADLPGRYPGVTVSRLKHSLTDGYERLPELLLKTGQHPETDASHRTPATHSKSWSGADLTFSFWRVARPDLDLIRGATNQHVFEHRLEMGVDNLLPLRVECLHL